LSHDIVDSRPAPPDAAGLVVPVGVQGQLAEEGTVVGENPHVPVGDEEVDGFVADVCNA
jgi:hypothetical protein